MTKWLMDAKHAAKIVRMYRKSGETGRLVVAPEKDLDAVRDHFDSIRYERNRLYACVEAMGQGKSRCPWCDEYKSCKHPKKGNVRGCEDWMLSMDVEEIGQVCEAASDKTQERRKQDEQAAAAEDRTAEQENQAAPGRDDQGGENGVPGQERDHGGEPGAGMA